MSLSSRQDGVTPRVSVVIPAFNAASVIEDAIQSALSQTVPDIEVIVVNDGSPDTATMEQVLEQYRNRVTYIKQDNRGPSAARNAGIRLARGEFIAFLDADDMLLPFFVEEHLARAREHPDADVFYGDLEIFGGVADAGRTVMESNPSVGAVDFESLVTQRCNPMLCSIVRRHTLLEYNGFDETMRRSEDYDLWLRMAHGGVRFNYTTRVVARYRLHGGGLAADVVAMTRGMRTALQKSANTMTLSAERRALVARRDRELLALERLHEAKRALREGRFNEARLAVSEANAILGRWKLRLVSLVLTLAPTFLLRAYVRRRERGAKPVRG